ncbi:putative IWS1 transcription factor [Cryptosporidium felis]|nr:putative IWS1 transcription factor [Cryptosporidium felis]
MIGTNEISPITETAEPFRSNIPNTEKERIHNSGSLNISTIEHCDTKKRKRKILYNGVYQIDNYIGREDNLKIPEINQSDGFLVDDESSEFDEDDIIRVEGGIRSSDDEDDEEGNKAQIGINQIHRKKSKLRRQPSELEIRTEIREFIRVMKEAAENDIIAYSEGKIAISKLKLVDEVCKKVSMSNLSGYFVTEGVLDVLSQWLSPFKDGTLPNLSIRTKVLKLLSCISIGEDDLVSTELGKTLCELWKNTTETLENRQIIRILIQRWVRLISKTRPLEGIDSTSFKDKRDSQVRTSQLNSNANAPQIEQRTARVPINTGYNFKIIPRSDEPNLCHEVRNTTEKPIETISRSKKARNKSKHAMKISLEGRGL